MNKKKASSTGLKPDCSTIQTLLFLCNITLCKQIIYITAINFKKIHIQAMYHLSNIHEQYFTEGLIDFELCSERNIQVLGFSPLNIQGQWRGSPLRMNAQKQ